MPHKKGSKAPGGKGLNPQASTPTLKCASTPLKLAHADTSGGGLAGGNKEVTYGIYCVVKLNGKEVSRTAICKDIAKPTWNAKVTKGLIRPKGTISIARAFIVVVKDQ